MNDINIINELPTICSIKQITDKGAKKQKQRKSKFPREKVFIVNENFANIKMLSDIYADLLYSAYCKQKAKNI